MKLILKLQQSHELESVGSSKSFTEGGGTIGRLPTCRWQLKDDSCSLSREHAKIYTDNGLFYLEDNSTNGVFINHSILALGKEKAHLLSSHDQITMGDYHFIVESIQTDKQKKEEDFIPQLEIQLNPNIQEKKSQIPLSELFTEDNSLMQTEEKETKNLFSKPDNDNTEAKTGDDIMAGLTGESHLSEYATKEIDYISGKDSHGMEMDSSFKIPEPIPDNFMEPESSDISPIKDKTEAQNNKPLESNSVNTVTQQMIPDDFFSEIQTHQKQDIDYKKVCNEFFIALNIKKEPNNTESLSKIMKKIANIVKRYTIEHKNKEKGKGKGKK